jgi:ornithine cyclodeaminase/alanine dehydrogenase-like protein (mu-crystallin family)
VEAAAGARALICFGEGLQVRFVLETARRARDCVRHSNLWARFCIPNPKF